VTDFFATKRTAAVPSAKFIAYRSTPRWFSKPLARHDRAAGQRHVIEKVAQWWKADMTRRCFEGRIVYDRYRRDGDIQTRHRERLLRGQEAAVPRRAVESLISVPWNDDRYCYLAVPRTYYLIAK
jgi:hypothetical protein